MKFLQNLNQQNNQKFNQKLSMTHQIQQSIKILKYDSANLNNYIKQKELENPFIEIKYPNNNSVKKKSKINLSQIIDSSNNTSLDNYLLKQINLNMKKNKIRDIVVYLIGNLDDNGYLNMSIKEIINKTHSNKSMVTNSLNILQHLDPPGIGARNLQECLLLQVRFATNSPKFTLDILQNDFNDLINKKWYKITKKYKIGVTKINNILKYIRTLSPAPGALYNNDKIKYIFPDLNIKIKNSQIKINLVNYSFPKINFNNDYFKILSSKRDPKLQKFLKEKQLEFKQLSNELEKRETTILKVGRAIIRHQKSFFIDKKHPILPLSLGDIANELKLNESTISRAVNGKYMKTPLGIFEMKFFFSNALQNKKNTISSHDIKQQIIKIVKNENKQKPFSDQEIAKILKTKNIQISRRTVAKYRINLKILSSSKRKMI